MVFIIDDDQYVRNGFRMLLRSAGLECKSFDSAEEFLAFCEPGGSDLILLDLHMPGMGGCGLIRYFSEKDMHIQMIIITAFDEPVSRACAEKYGVVGYLRKPVDGDILLNLIRENEHMAEIN